MATAVLITFASPADDATAAAAALRAAAGEFQPTDTMDTQVAPPVVLRGESIGSPSRQ